MTSLTATLARALELDSMGSGWGEETQEYRDSWYRYAERVLSTEHGQRIVDMVEAAESHAKWGEPATYRALEAALDALGEPSDDAGAAA